jgi:hypothetical protein
MEDDPAAYQARYGLSGRTALVIAGSAVFVVLGIMLPMSPGVRIIDFALCGGGGLVLLGAAASRRVAFRVDSAGVTLGGIPPRYRSGTKFVPWAEIERIVLWKQRLPPYGVTMRYVGVARRANAPPLAGPRAQAVARVTARALAPVSGDILMASRAVNGWRLDEDRLAAAVRHLAPGVAIDR